MVLGLSHITFIVKDIMRTAILLKKVFDAKEIYSSGDKTFSYSKEKYFSINGVWLCIMEGEPLQERTYNHIAFQIDELDEHEIDEYITKINEAGAMIIPGRTRVEGEGKSIYFYDYDNHLFELHTGSLADRLACYRVVNKQCF